MSEQVRWLSKAEAAEELEVSMSTLDRMNRRGEVEVRREGQRCRQQSGRGTLLPRPKDMSPQDDNREVPPHCQNAVKTFEKSKSRPAGHEMPGSGISL